MKQLVAAEKNRTRVGFKHHRDRQKEKTEHTSRLDAADDDVVDLIVSDLLVVTSENSENKNDVEKVSFATHRSVHTCGSTSTA
jgi:hypothetical protein